VAAELAPHAESSPLEYIAGDHLLSLIDTELAWIDRSVAFLREKGWAETPDEGPTNQTAQETIQGQ
jgi:hypothetical protein